MTEPELACFEGRYGYWDAATEVAWQLRDTSVHHEEPCSRLAELVKDIGKLRGRPITLFGTADLQERDEHDNRLLAMQADQLIYLNRPDYLPENVVVIGRFPLPDVVFEVDLTTDIRQRKLQTYAKWRIPELWVEVRVEVRVEVPNAPMRSRAKRPGLAIYAFEDGQYRQRGESMAFPTWTAQEIHAAVNEPASSAITVGILRRVGREMGHRSGTGPDNDPFLGAERRSARRQGAAAERLAMLESLLQTRQIEITGKLREAADDIEAVPGGALVQAAMACRDVDDLVKRLRNID